MRVLSFHILKMFGRIPRFSDGQAVLYSVLPRDKVFLIMVSHRWLQPRGSIRWPQGDPDDDACSKYHLIVAAVSKCVGMLRDGMSEENVFLWIDFACVDQDRLASSVPGAIIPTPTQPNVVIGSDVVDLGFAYL